MIEILDMFDGFQAMLDNAITVIDEKSHWKDELKILAIREDGLGHFRHDEDNDKLTEVQGIVAVVYHPRKKEITFREVKTDNEGVSSFKVTKGTYKFKLNSSNDGHNRDHCA